MKGKLVFVVLLVFVFSAFSCFAQSSGNDQRIVGTWVHTNSNGNTITLVFNANGSGSAAYSWDGGTVNFTYGISLAGAIITTVPRIDEVAGNSLYFSPDGRTLILNDRIYRKR